MKLSKPLLGLILIASALLLGAAKNVSGKPRIEQDASKIEATSNRNESGSNPVATPINQSTTEKSGNDSGGVTYNYNGTFKYVAPATPPESGWKKFGDIATVASTIAVAFFTGMLWYVSKQQKALAETTEEIARRSVEVTELALNAQRPYIFLESAEFHLSGTGILFGDKSKVDANVGFVARNRGAGIAIIKKVRANLIIAPGLKAGFQSKLKTNAKEELFKSGQILGAGERQTFHTVGFHLEPNLWESVSRFERAIIVVGMVWYEDVFHREYRKTFALNYLPIDDKEIFPSKGAFIEGSARHNRFI